MARNRIDARTHPVPPFDISRRDLIVGGGAMVAAFGLPMPLLADQPSPASTPAPHGDSQGENLMNVITTTDGTRIYFKDWGTGQPVVFSHGWPLTADAWDSQMLFLGEKGYRVIAHDRRGHGRSSQSWNGNEMDTYADDLAKLIETLDLKNATLVGHSTGGGEVARYIGRHGS
ncbi:MAG TPA: alpha/beta fold hydrolase, partial [Terriglobales bacterium]|nr:alpha/beta fold hydrolase [Terriglobales bacterium]